MKRKITDQEKKRIADTIKACDDQTALPNVPENELKGRRARKFMSAKLTDSKNRHKDLFLVERVKGCVDAVVPTLGSDGALGYDLYSIDAGVIPAQGTLTVRTGIRFSFPAKMGADIKPRSSLGKLGIVPMNGLIDTDYRGEIKLIMFNHSKVDYKFEARHRLAQLVLLKNYAVSIPLKEVQPGDIEELMGDTKRGSKGFGSTGK